MRLNWNCKPVGTSLLTKAAGMAAVCMLAAAPGWSQTTGMSKPMPVTMTSTDDSYTPSAAPATVAAPVEKPSAAVPASSMEVYAPYNPATDTRRPLVSETSVDNNPNDPDAGIVTHVPSLPGEIPDGTLLRAKLRESLSTLTTQPGTRFSAEVTEPVMRDGRVVVPVGSVLNGRVTWVRGGKRISGGAGIHIEPKSVTLPDGTQYSLHARVIDTSSWDNTTVDREGTISRRADGKRNAGVMSLTTGGGAAAGAMMGGPAGALIGAGVGAGVSTIVWLKEDKQAELPKDLGLVFSLTMPMAVTPEKAGATPMSVGAAGGQ